jgi:hypothetical protein
MSQDSIEEQKKKINAILDEKDASEKEAQASDMLDKVQKITEEALTPKPQMLTEADQEKQK